MYPLAARLSRRFGHAKPWPVALVPPAVPRRPRPPRQTLLAAESKILTIKPLLEVPASGAGRNKVLDIGWAWDILCANFGWTAIERLIGKLLTLPGHWFRLGTPVLGSE